MHEYDESDADHRTWPDPKVPPCLNSDDGHHRWNRGPHVAVGNKIGALRQCVLCRYIARGVDMVDLDAGESDG